MWRSIGKISLKIVAAVGLLGGATLAVKAANDVSNSAYKDLKNEVQRTGRELKNRREHPEMFQEEE